MANRPDKGVRLVPGGFGRSPERALWVLLRPENGACPHLR